MIDLTIDNQKVEVEEGTTILEAADKLNIAIPTLCHHENLSPFGSCRLCTVEIVVNGASELTTACTCPVEQGMEVKTNSEKALEARRLAAELLLAKCPSSEKIQNLARDMGIEKPRVELEEETCILCGLCVRACQELVGVGAIKFIEKGLNRDVPEPFIEASPDICIGCGSCAYICPTNFIKLKEDGDTRTIWDRVFKLKKCKVCGNYWAPEAQLEYITEKLNLPPDFFDVCPNCK
ncbi:MAG: 2Fe-2S iron-sulfur cluster-binding protein [Chloroflexota bacterium]|nr:2Fe-2S iron-sulfur cluster-binding protein [Chloroflexota bacterium]